MAVQPAAEAQVAEQPVTQTQAAQAVAPPTDTVLPLTD
jgi:hypothetical protein